MLVNVSFYMLRAHQQVDCLAYNLIHDFDLKYIDGTIVLLAAVRILSADDGLRERTCLRGSFVAQTPCAG